LLAYPCQPTSNRGNCAEKSAAKGVAYYCIEKEMASAEPPPGGDHLGDDPDLVKKGASGADDFDSELQNNTSAFEALERDFQEVLGELMGDQSLEKFRLEYEKLHRALKKSHEQEKRLVKKCRELNSEILNNQAKIKTALRLSQEDQKTIAHLQKEMEKTWKLVYLSQDKENRAKDTISALKEEMTNLSKLVERGAGLSVNQENLVKELKQAKDELQRQVEEQKTLLERLDHQLEEQHQVQEELRAERDESNRTVEEVRERLAIKESDNLREIKRREKTQKELLDARIKLDTCAKTEERLRGEIQKGKDSSTELERQLVDARTTMDKYLKDYDSLHDRTVKVTEDLDAQVNRNKQLHTDFAALDKDLNLKRIEISRLTTEKNVLERKLDKEHRAALHFQQVAEDSKTPLMVAQTEIENLNNDIVVRYFFFLCTISVVFIDLVCLG
jgi:chromosome segregation ATPase